MTTSLSPMGGGVEVTVVLTQHWFLCAGDKVAGVGCIHVVFSVNDFFRNSYMCFYVKCVHVTASEYV